MKDWQIALCTITLILLLAKAYGVYREPFYIKQLQDYGSPNDPCDGLLDKRARPWCPQ